MEPIETIQSTRVKGLNVALYGDDEPSPLNTYHGMPYTVRVWSERSGDGEVYAGEHWAPVLDAEDIARARAHYRDDDLVIRYLRIMWEAVDVECIQPGSDDDRWYLVATPEYVTQCLGITGDPKKFTPEQRAKVRADLVKSAQIATDWREGDVYRWELESPSGTDGACGDYIGWAWAKENALEALRDAELDEPVAFPQQRPHFSRPRSDALWKAVIVPALMGETRADYFTVRTVLPPRDREWGVDLRIGWGIDTTTEQHLDEARTWAALVACATGALRIDSAVALECRDLALADWQGTPAPLSQRAAETVVQVALLGSAPYPDVH